ncbi:FtsW/RodA/SpoVE family cell cycle protein [Peribacillus sp. AS_2]|uniref:FtsW/RodA/SpoVE family cell cycle protein n=1 Tax=Peribacillus sp. AS_2 TaxID=2996755 RepID=UPI0022A742FB|nr:FtsW/RodA/SpoVE family cell cycle protein [Peribacillus sp. AS_2]MCZ0874944.1 FtsW/RodA/SpoVE family cell cycle protein [Peribacillus sp. AS_2]
MKKRQDSFLKEVTNHIKSKEAKKFIATELEFHLEKSKNTWKEKGLNEIDAEDKAVEQMGSPIKIGQELNKLHRPRIDWLMVILLVTTMGLGFLPIVSLGNAGFMDVNHFLRNKVIFVILGAAVAFGMMMIDYRKLEKQGWLFYTIGVIILLIINFFSNTIINAAAFVRIGSITIESFMAVPFFFLSWTSFFNNSRLKVWYLGSLFLLSFYLFLTVASISTVFIYTIMVFVMLWWSKVDKKNALIITVVPICLSMIGGLFIWSSIEDYQKERLLGYLNPENYANGAGYTYLHLKELISTAGWFGTTENKEFIESAHTDLVFASLTYYYGYLFATILVFILSLFTARMIVISYKINNHYGKLLLVGGIALYVAQFIYNVGMTLGLFPITSISLPFISYGLMPTLFNAFLMGIVLSVYRRKDLTSNNFS